MTRPLLLLASVLTLTSCVRDMGGWYEPPMPRTPRLGAVSPYSRPFVRMSDKGVEGYFVRDIEPTVQGNAWRWTGKSPALHLQIPYTQGEHFVADLTLPENGLKQTGPVQITIQINGRTLKTLSYDKPGPEHIDLPIPAEWLTTQLENYAVLEIDKTWRVPGMDHDYGFVLTDAGFVGQL